jgi:hypothetical protein
MVRSAPKERVSNHEAASPFETHRFAMLLRMRRLAVRNYSISGAIFFST